MSTVTNIEAGQVFDAGNSLLAPGTYYYPVAQSIDQVKTGTESNVQNRINTGVTSNDLFINVHLNSLNGASTVTTRINGANGSLSVSIPAGGTGTFEDLTHSDSLVSPNLYDVQLVAGGTSGTINITVVRVIFSSSLGGVSLWSVITFASASNSVAGGSTVFSTVGGSNGPSVIGSPGFSLISSSSKTSRCFRSSRLISPRSYFSIRSSRSFVWGLCKSLGSSLFKNCQKGSILVSCATILEFKSFKPFCISSICFALSSSCVIRFSVFFSSLKYERRRAREEIAMLAAIP